MIISGIPGKNLKKSVLLFLLVTCASLARAQQATHRDSVIKAARVDAKNFRLDDATWKKYHHKLPYTSDYFKPQASGLKDTTLLSDSVYVDAYRQAAFKRNKHRHTPWHYVLVGGGIAAGLVVVAVAGIIIFIAPTM
ncbi:hypothetical protein SNE26_18675 [Mucilaginibacter sp. cycad4]|uniref:hypothetical protein n=1 Tax=Mucilaginibacter sp. cycad4 TaxID=3342096 RepID=UPI002AAB7321|nr:hypothetical protein [Mucilaginibacter gossypii]WPU98052.1 hypothetical protein SNE26_18675 [Mucilaginibacter gossypii]